MGRWRPRKSVRFLVFVSGLAVLGGCGARGAVVNVSNYPPDFKFIDDERIDSAMWRMAAQVRDLDHALRAAELDSDERQRLVVAALDGIRGAVDRVHSDAAVSNHPLLDRHLPSLRDDAAQARAAAAETPPRYALAGAVAGACVYCHDSRVAPPHEP